MGWDVSQQLQAVLSGNNVPNFLVSSIFPLQLVSGIAMHRQTICAGGVVGSSPSERVCIYVLYCSVLSGVSIPIKTRHLNLDIYRHTWVNRILSNACLRYTESLHLFHRLSFTAWPALVSEHSRLVRAVRSSVFTCQSTCCHCQLVTCQNYFFILDSSKTWQFLKEEYSSMNTGNAVRSLTKHHWVCRITQSTRVPMSYKAE